MNYRNPREDALSSSPSQQQQRSQAAVDYDNKACHSYPSLLADVTKKYRSLCNDSSNQSLCDASFEIGDKKQVFHVVAALFAIHSVALNEMLAEHKSQGHGQLIVIDDITSDCFIFLRQYFYSLNPLMSLDNISDVLYAATKLKVASLVETAKQFITEVTGVNDLLLILAELHQRRLYDEVDRQISDRRLFQDAAAVFGCENYKALPTELMIRLLQHDQNYLAEERVFEKVVTWAKFHQQHFRELYTASMYKCSLDPRRSTKAKEETTQEEIVQMERGGWQHIIQPLLPFVRFPVMDGGYFAENIVDLKILSSDDTTLIMQFFFCQENKDTLKYGVKPRHLHANAKPHQAGNGNDSNRRAGRGHQAANRRRGFGMK